MLDVGPQALDELALTVEELRDEVRVLREVLDEMLDAVQWWNNNAADLHWGETQLPARPSGSKEETETSCDPPKPAPRKQQSFL